MRTFAALFRRRPEAPDPQEAIRLLQIERCRDREHIVRLESMLRVETARAVDAEQALDEFGRGIRAGHAQVLADNARLRRENELLRRDREGALHEVDRLTSLDDKTLATVNAGAKAAA